MKPFCEAWMNEKGEVFHDGESHFEIASNYMKSVDPDSYMNLGGDNCYEDCGAFYVAAYDYMYSHGFARLVLTYSKTLMITLHSKGTNNAALIEAAINLCKEREFKELANDRNDRTIWSRENKI